MAPAAITVELVHVTVWPRLAQSQPVPPEPAATYVSPAGRTSITVTVPIVGAVPKALLGMSRKVADPPTVKVLADVLSNVRSGAFTVSVSLALLLTGTGSVVPAGTAMVAVLVTLPVLAVTFAVTVSW